MIWHAFWRANVAFRGYRLYVITPITTITLMHWRTAYALLLPNMANRICYCSLIMAFPSVMQMKAMITRNVDRKSTRLNSSHVSISYAVFCLKKKRKKNKTPKQDHR